MIREFVDRYASPEERTRLLAAFLTLSVLLGMAALFFTIVVPGLRGSLAPAPSGAPLAGPSRTGWLDPTGYPARQGYTLPPVDSKALLAGSADLLARGRELYATHCAACHGAMGRGDGPASTGLTPRPRDFTNAGGWKNGAGFPGLYATLAKGIAGSSMAAYDFLSRPDRMALAHAVRSFAPAPAPPGEAAELSRLEAELGGAGETVPPRIPVGLAVERIVAEASVAPPALPHAASFAALPPAWSRVVADPARAARVLRASPAWRDEPSALARMAVAGAPGNGFLPSAASLPSDEWLALHAALVPLFPAEEVKR